jgi:hypothetical protein
VEPAWWDSDEGSFPGVQTAAFLLCPHMAEKGRKEEEKGEREREREKEREKG